MADQSGSAAPTNPDEVEYGWLITYAEDQYKSLGEARKGLEDKASTIITQLSGGTGAATLGAILAVVSNKVDETAIRWMLLPIIVAIAAIILAMIARGPSVIWLTPRIEQMKKFTEHFKKEELTKGAAMVDMWAKLINFSAEAVARKSCVVTAAMVCYIVSIASLIVPFCVAAFGRK